MNHGWQHNSQWLGPLTLQLTSVLEQLFYCAQKEMGDVENGHGERFWWDHYTDNPYLWDRSEISWNWNIFQFWEFLILFLTLQKSLLWPSGCSWGRNSAINVLSRLEKSLFLWFLPFALRSIQCRRFDVGWLPMLTSELSIALFLGLKTVIACSR